MKIYNVENCETDEKIKPLIEMERVFDSFGVCPTNFFDPNHEPFKLDCYECKCMIVRSKGPSEN